MDRSLFSLINSDIEAGVVGALCTIVSSKGSTPRGMGTSMWVRSDGSIIGSIGGGSMEFEVIEKSLALLTSGGGPILYEAVLKETESAGKAVCGGEVVIMIEPIGQQSEIVIFGAGHLGKALAKITFAAGFPVTVWDEREDFANPRNIPWGRTFSCPPEKLFDEKGIRLHPSSYVVVVTRGHELDTEIVRILEGRPLAYLGVIGSRKKIATMRNKLLALGASETFLDGIFQPVGLPIGAETPEEIAISILAEIIALRRGSDLDKLRLGYLNTPGPCYPDPFLDRR